MKVETKLGSIRDNPVKDGEAENKQLPLGNIIEEILLVSFQFLIIDHLFFFRASFFFNLIHIQLDPPSFHFPRRRP